jgi:hypothetical protein
VQVRRQLGPKAEMVVVAATAVSGYASYISTGTGNTNTNASSTNISSSSTGLVQHHLQKVIEFVDKSRDARVVVSEKLEQTACRSGGGEKERRERVRNRQIEEINCFHLQCFSLPACHSIREELKPSGRPI